MSQALEAKLGYRFNNDAYLQQALRHRSVGGDHNQRLEFLGDALLGWLVAQWLCERLPTASEGRLTRLRARLVGREYLAQVAKRLDLAEALHVDASSFCDGVSDKVLVDALEAVFAALYLDAGAEASDLIIKCLVQDLPTDWDRVQDKDAKTLLQEYTQAHGLGLPVYQVIEDVAVGPGYYKVVLEAAGERLEGHAKAAKPLQMQLAQALLARLAQRGQDGAH